jgi:hypothetical protein
MRAHELGYVALQLWLQLVALVLAFALGRWRWAVAIVLVMYLLVLGRIGRRVRAEARYAPGHRLALGIAGQLPGLVLSSYVALSFAGVLGEASESVVVLQAWTAMWAPLLALAPTGVMLDARAVYLWLTLVVPFIQLAWLVDAMRVRPGK